MYDGDPSVSLHAFPCGYPADLEGHSYSEYIERQRDRNF